ncbi:hypothetical protein [Actinoplanes sp. DH11]|uniref:hypothetical protein n=1 Tax=Actinoplanes sp. DH11 TaxID=2857011 RepID=UPI001E5F76E5|nr:hypothetical protein [Actinoplanes sp. DH11]
MRVVNSGSAARNFTVTISYPSANDVWVQGAWNASFDGDDNYITMSGSVGGGKSLIAGFQAGKDSGDSVRSASCSVGGGTCRVS